MGSVIIILNAEYVPVQVKGVAGGIVVSITRIAGGIVTGTYLNFTNWAGDYTLWWIFAATNFVSVIVIGLFFVETKGKSLEEVPELFKKKYPCLKDT